MKAVVWIATAAASLLIFGADARADSETTFVGGASISGDISVLNEADIDFVTSSIKNSPLFGLRVGSYGYPLGFEGSLIYSPSGLTGGALNDLIQANANILYVEANLLLIILPGPIAPFVTGGAGLHYFNFNIADLVSFNNAKFGYNLGGGLKINASRVTFRIDLRDHVSTITLDDFSLGLIGDLLGITLESRLHNVELSFGVGIRF
jgi:opacity protein-like surface antigen